MIFFAPILWNVKVTYFHEQYNNNKNNNNNNVFI